MEDVFAYTKEIEQFMLKNGFTDKECKKHLSYWYENPSTIIFHETIEYWYYNFIINEYNQEHLDYRFHNGIRFNEYFIKKSKTAGCIACNQIVDISHIKFLYVEDKVGTAQCPLCQQLTIVGNTMKHNLIRFAKNIDEAHHFWFVYKKYNLMMIKNDQ